MKHASPQPPELGEQDGLSYALFLPDRRPTAGVVILHGAGSAKESHFDFGRLCREAGLAALACDARGHGSSEGAFGPSAIDDAVAMCSLLRQYAPQVALRGSSLGGWMAIHAAAASTEVAAVVAICPAPEELLLRGLRSGDLEGFRVDRAALEPFLEQLDLMDAARRLGREGFGTDAESFESSRQTALLLLHARGDEQVPYTVSEELHAAAQEPKRLILFPGGHHRSLQHDPEVQNLSLRFIADATRARAD
ncbi:MAG TPA: alpha/beta fold hydrolase [Thermoleophilaceae bacterium]|nr:alpha/beta fold hydrolase [Thermoleophilaceae bacterium]